MLGDEIARIPIEEARMLNSIVYLFLNDKEFASIKRTTAGGLVMVICNSNGFNSLAQLASNDTVQLSKDGKTIQKVSKDIFEREYGKEIQAVYMSQGVYLKRELKAN